MDLCMNSPVFLEKHKCIPHCFLSGAYTVHNTKNANGFNQMNSNSILHLDVLVSLFNSMLFFLTLSLLALSFVIC